MCQLAAASLGPRAQVIDVEREIAQPSRTLVTVRALMVRHPEHQFSWIVGGDLVSEIDTWYGAAELRRTVPFLIVGRAGAAMSATVMMPAVSSTDVRRALAEGKSVEGLVPRTVLDYIYQRGLYQAREPE
jgi:nicotinate-nucleotide adenylyltransferase